MKPTHLLLACTRALLSLTTPAQEATIRKNLAERIPQLPKIDEVSKTPMNGLYEVRVNGAELYYTDAEGNYLIQGNLIDLRQRRNLTEERQDKLSSVNFDALPLKDAFTVVRGNGKRKVAVFADPNCGYCKRFERDLEKASNIWCAKDRARVWQDWMLRDQAITPAPAPGCDTAAISRNVELGRKHRITGTPTLIFADGSRVPGAITTQQIEKQLAAVR